jgi:hypothetical protein
MMPLKNSKKETTERRLYIVINKLNKINALFSNIAAHIAIYAHTIALLHN